ncbi:MAG TPA: septum formation initiator family protein [Acidimicrobiales bacterium]
MRRHHANRWVLLGAALCAAVIVVAWFPAREIVGQHNELRAVNGQLSTLAKRNASLSADISALSANSTIAAIAHEQYGLVRRGQTSYVILPAVGSSAANGALTTTSIAPQDLIAAPIDQPRPASTRGSSAGSASFWSRFASHLEFWRWAA